MPPIAPIGPASAPSPIGLPAATGPGQSAGGSFGTMLEQAIGNLNDLQVQADQAEQGLASGQIKDVAQAVIAAEKASLGLQLAVQVRNKAIQAYQQIMQMQM